VEVFTRARCLGFAVSPDQHRIAVAAIGPGSTQPTGLQVYDRSGMVMYRRLDAVKDPHDLRWSEAGIEVVSTGTNEIVTFDEAGEVVSVWTPVPGLEGDCWHLNCPAEAEGREYVCAFGDFRVDRGWNHPLEKARGRGFLYDIAKGKPLLRGLTAPHSPLWTSRSWLVCDSGVGDLVEFSANGVELRRKHIAGWTRGMILEEEWLLVGTTSSSTMSPEKNSSALFLLDRQDWEVIEELDLAGYEPYTLALVPSDLLTGLRVGETGSSMDTRTTARAVRPSATCDPGRVVGSTD
jgi:acetolactate synthase-1/2/3 large subunit